MGALIVAAGALGTWAAIARRGAVLDPARVLVLRPTTTTSDAALAALVEMTPDVVTRGFSEMPWVKIASAPGAAGAQTSERELRTLGRDAGAGTIVTGALYAIGDSVQVRFRVVDGRTGAVIRALAPVGAPRAAARDAINAAADRLLSAVGFVSAPHLGAYTLPLGEPPNFAAFREFEAATALISTADPVLGSTLDTARVSAIERRLTRAAALDTAFVQPRLWRAVRLNSVYHWPWVIAALDSILPWTRRARDRMTPFENTLAECIVNGPNGVSDASLDALRRLALIAPNSPFLAELPRNLADINRPRAALTVATAWYNAHRRTDSLGGAIERGYLVQVTELQHFMGDHREELRSARKARATAPNNLDFLRQELFALAALGDTATVERLLDELAASVGSREMFGFMGDVYLTVGQDLIAHGSSGAGVRVLKRGEAWFDRRRGGPEWAGQVPFRAAILYAAIGRDDDALAICRELSRKAPRDVRYRGQVARILARRGDTAAVARELAWFASLSSQEYRGATSTSAPRLPSTSGARTGTRPSHCWRSRSTRDRDSSSGTGSTISGIGCRCGTIRHSSEFSSRGAERSAEKKVHLNRGVSPMAMLHDAAVRESLLARMKSLRADTPRHWGSMSIDQMCWHLADGLEMALGKRPYGTVKLPPLPKSVIKFAVLNLPWPRGAPTIDTLRATSRHDFEAERSRCLRLLDEMGRRDLAATWPAHPAFGAVDGTFHSRLQAKHVEHHLRQFGA